MSHRRSEPTGARRRAAAVVVMVALLIGFGATPTVFDRGAFAAPTDPDDPPVSTDPGVASTVPDTAPPSVEEPVWSDPGVPDTSWEPQTPATDWQPADEGSGQWVPETAAPSDPPRTAGAAPMTTTENLLIGPSTTAAPSTTVAKRSLSGSSVTRTDGSSDPKVWAVVAGLVAIAVALGVATFLYWRRTRPAPDGSGTDRPRTRFSDLTITSPDPG